MQRFIIKKDEWSKVVLVGGDFLRVEHPFISFQNAEEAKEWFRKQHFENMHILIKGSRSMKMEKILEP